MMRRGAGGAAIVLVLGCGPGEDPPSSDESGSSTGDAATSVSSTSAGPSGSSTASTTSSTATSEPPETSDGSSGAPEETGSSTDDPPIELDCEGSVLADLVADMPARSWRTMPDNESLDALEMGYSLLYWNDSAVWDPNRRRLQWIGGPGTCCADPAQYRLLAYDELTDTWTIEDTPFVGSGHAYDGNAMDPSTGIHYFSMFNDQEVKTFDGESWDALPPIPFSATATSGLTWFDALGGLVYVGQYGSVAWWDGSAWTELPGAEKAPWGSYNTFAEHSARHQVVWAGAGNDGDRVNYVIDANGTLTRGTDAPVSLNNSQTLKAVDPVSGNFLVGDTEVARWWEYQPLTDTWTEIDDMTDHPDMSNHSVFHVPLPHCGVTLFFGHYYENRDTWLYRHSPV